MSKLKVRIGEPYNLNEEGLEEITEIYGGTFMGSWAIKDDNGSWSEEPLDIFYVKDPDLEAGHSNYFGIFFKEEECYICNGATAFCEPMAGMVDGNEVKVSRYRHDRVDSEDGQSFIDGGRDYTRLGGNPDIRTVIVEADQFIVTGAG